MKFCIGAYTQICWFYYSGVILLKLILSMIFYFLIFKLIFIENYWFFINFYFLFIFFIYISKNIKPSNRILYIVRLNIIFYI